MSSSALDSLVNTGSGEGSNGHARWFPPASVRAEVTPQDLAATFLHFQVELPSRRWYVESAEGVAGE